MSMLSDAYTHNDNEPVIVLATELRNVLKVVIITKVESIFNTIFKSIPYEVRQKEKQPEGVPHFYHTIIHLTSRLLGIYIESHI